MVPIAKRTMLIAISAAMNSNGRSGLIIRKRGHIEDDDTPVKLLVRYGRRTLEEVFLDVARGREREAVQ